MDHLQHQRLGMDFKTDKLPERRQVVGPFEPTAANRSLNMFGQGYT